MPLPSSGSISLSQVNVELGLSATAAISMNNAAVRTLFGVGGSGTAISMSQGYGKANRKALSFTYASNTANASLNVSAISGYAAGTSDITITVNSGVYLYATSTGSAGLTLTGGTTGDTITLVNNGFIMGMGGAGGANPNAGAAGGPAISLGFNTTINNTNGSAYIGGGGGGGGSAAPYGGYGGGGAGGGSGGSIPGGGSNYYGSNGAGGGPGASGNDGGAALYPDSYGYPAFVGASGGGGGRVFPGTGGAGGSGGGFQTLYGRGGTAGGGGCSENVPGYGGAGGSANGAGGAGSTYGTGGGGGWGASGGAGRSGAGGVGGGGGRAIQLNGRSVTWVSGNTARVYGAVS